MENVPALSEHALMLLHERYLRRDPSGHIIEEPDELWARVAAAVAAPARQFGEDAALWESRFFEHLRQLRFLPNSPTPAGSWLHASSSP
jgi:ribonucleoside-diphosphate reductase alpha chain